jgi:hypothetical protein
VDEPVGADDEAHDDDLRLIDQKGNLTDRGHRVWDELFGTLYLELGDPDAAAGEARWQIEAGEADELARQLDEAPPPFPPEPPLGPPPALPRPIVLHRARVLVRRVRVRLGRRRPARTTRARPQARAPARPDDPDLHLAARQACAALDEELLGLTRDRGQS